MTRPDIDDLKRERDGQTSYGRPPPTCSGCDGRIHPMDPDVVLEKVKTAEGSFTRYYHDVCHGSDDDGADG